MSLLVALAIEMSVILGTASPTYIIYQTLHSYVSGPTATSAIHAYPVSISGSPVLPRTEDQTELFTSVVDVCPVRIGGRSRHYSYGVSVHLLDYPPPPFLETVSRAFYLSFLSLRNHSTESPDLYRTERVLSVLTMYAINTGTLVA